MTKNNIIKKMLKESLTGLEHTLQFEQTELKKFQKTVERTEDKIKHIESQIEAIKEELEE